MGRTRTFDIPLSIYGCEVMAIVEPGNEQPPQEQPIQQIGSVALQPLQDGQALAQISINGACSAVIVIPKPVVKAFIAEYAKTLKGNQEILRVVRNSKVH